MEQRIKGTTGLLALIGSPVGHSGSPDMYNFCFRYHNLDYSYMAFDIKEDQVPAALDAMRLFKMRGCNVTMPCKTAAAQNMDELSPAARIIGAVNTIVNENGKLIGHMTDGIGFVENLRDHGVDVKGKKLVILGAGGAATAIQVQCALDGATSISIFNPDDPFLDRAKGTAAKLKNEVPDCNVQVFCLDDPGKLKEETEQLIEIQEICRRINRMPHNGTWALYFQMEYAFNTGHFSEAEDALSTLETTESYREDLSIQIRCLHYQAMLSYFYGDTASLKESRKKLHELMNTAQPFQALLARMSDESLDIILPSKEGGDRQNQAINSSMFYFPALTFLHIVEDERLVHPGNGRTLLASARRHEKLARQRRSLIGEIHALLHQAIACDMLHENAQCLEAMEKALRLAEPDHLIIPFLTVKNRLASRWAHLKASPAYSLLKDIMDSRFESAGQILEKEIHLDQLSKKLTAREMGIIRLVMKGRTNKEIAAEMNVAEITIKKALSLIYKKLDIKNRAQLVGMFKEK